ncbi:MAG TPA: hypothetical protein DCZ30_06655, partial [Clostridiales bacterium]|nr:hypothetical protein [Clostridiales bacterium]
MYNTNKLKDLVTIQYGKNQKAVEDNENGKVPILGTGGTIGYATNFLYDKPSVLIGRKGTIDKIRYVDFPFWTIDTLFYTEINQKLVIPQYLYYKLLEINFKNLNEGTTIPSLRTQTLYELELDIDSIDKQNKIVNILSLIDKKIEYNMHTNNNLYEIMRLKFNEWIDNLEDYELSNLSSIANYKNGLAMQKYRPENEIGLPVIKIKEMNSGISAETERCKSDIDPEVIINNGDVLFAWSGTLCMTIWDSGKAGLNQHIFKVTSDKYPKWFYYFWTLKHLDKFIQIAAGKATTMGHIKRGELDFSEVLIPSSEELNKMNQIMSPMLDKYIENKLENKTLEQLRDT